MSTGVHTLRCAHVLEHVVAVHRRQHDVEHDDVVLAEQRQPQTLAAVGDEVDDPALLLEGVVERRRQGALVLDQ